MKNKKIRYVSLEPNAFISDVAFQLMTCEERGVYFTIILHLYENDGYLPMDKVLLNSWCNCTNFENVFEKIKHKFLIKNGKISHKRVLQELKRARQISQVQRERGLKANEIRWKNHPTGTPQGLLKDSSSIPKRSEGEEKRSEDKRREEKRSEEGEAQKEEEEKRNMASHFASPSISSNGSSPRHASQPTGTIPRDLTMMIINFHDDLCRIFPRRTPSDSSSIRNLVNWVGGRIRLGEFQDKIIGNVLQIARDSKKGKSRKPIAVFYARLQKELNYESDR